ncbi:MAG: two-component system response regulator [Proteobacteria bacterium]|nr:two-component system response regulator [Pseudomonadota bacterium]
MCFESASVALRPRILIVDDVPENIDVLGAILSDFKRLVATSGQKALERARTDPQPHLILLDVMMPKMDGFEVCHRLKADPRTADIPVIFVTALGAVDDETHGLELGAVDYVTKPISPPVVQARVKTHLSLSQARKELSSQNAVLEQRVDQRTHDLRKALNVIEEASLDTVVRLSRAAEYKDDDTGAHVLRMSHYAMAVGKKLGMSDGEAKALLHAAPMHDIGKIGIPDNILLKPGRLNDEEWQIMRRHSYMGAQILRDSRAGVIQLGEIVAYTHHEKWDGSGYPQGLSGTDIPLVGRVTAIGDVFDALTSKRPYKDPFSLEKSFAIIREGRGSHFDPDVVDAFFEVIVEILEYKERFADSGLGHLAQLTGT